MPREMKPQPKTDVPLVKPIAGDSKVSKGKLEAKMRTFSTLIERLNTKIEASDGSIRSLDREIVIKEEAYLKLQEELKKPLEDACREEILIESALEVVKPSIGRQIIVKDKSYIDLNLRETLITATSQYSSEMSITINEMIKNDSNYMRRTEEQVKSQNKKIIENGNTLTRNAIERYGSIGVFKDRNHLYCKIRRLYDMSLYVHEQCFKSLKQGHVYLQAFEKLDTEYQQMEKFLQGLKDKISNLEKQIEESGKELQGVIDQRKETTGQLEQDKVQKKAASQKIQGIADQIKQLSSDKGQAALPKSTSRSTDFALPPDGQQRMRDMTSQQTRGENNLARRAVSDASTHQVPSSTYRRAAGESVHTPESDRNLLEFLSKNKPSENVLSILSSVLRNKGVIDERSIEHPRQIMAILSKRNAADLNKLKEIRRELYNRETVTSSEDRSFIRKWKQAFDYAIYCEILDLSRQELGKFQLYTRAIIDLGTGEEPILTQIRKSEETPDIHTTYPEEMLIELRSTHTDAEVATLQDIRDTLEAHKKNGKRYETITVTILGEYGPCNGCNYRIKNFAKEWEMSGLCKALIMDACYTEGPRIVQKTAGPRIMQKDKELHKTQYETQFGRLEHAMKIRTFRGRTFYMENYAPSIYKVADDFLDHNAELPQPIKDILGQHGLSPEESDNLVKLINAKAKSLPKEKRIQIEQRINSITGKKAGEHVRDYFQEYTRIGNTGLLYGQVASDFLDHNAELPQQVKDILSQHLSAEEANNLVQLINSKAKSDKKYTQIGQKILNKTGQQPGVYVQNYFQALVRK